MFLPIDRRVNAHRPWATFGLVAANTACFFALFWGAGSVPGLQELWRRFGYTPSSPSLPAAATHLFIHANWEHLAGNMLFLVFLGMNCERRLGPAAFLGLYFLSGLGALCLFAAFNPRGTIPLGGASGAISGVAGMYLVLFPRKEVEVLWFALVAAGTLRTPAWIFSLLWAGCEIAQAALLNGTNHNVANLAHAGGFLVGVGGTAMLLKVFGYAGRPETPFPGRETPAQPDRFEELAYIPLLPSHETRGEPDTAVLRDPGRVTFFLAARQFGPPPAAAAALLPPHASPATPACVAGGLDPEAAENLRRRLQDAGYPCLLLPERARINVPPLVPTVALEFEGQDFLLRDEIGQVHRRPLSALYLASAGRVRRPSGEEIPLLDLFTTSPWIDFRLAGGNPAPLAREILSRARGIPVARALATLAREGSLPGPPFPDLASYETFNLWLIQIYASGVHRRTGA